MTAVIAIAHVLFVSIKSLSVNIMLLENFFGKLKYDSTTLLMSGFLGSSPVSASRSPVFLAILNFFKYIFSVGKSYPHSPDKNIHRRSPSIAHRMSNRGWMQERVVALPGQPRKDHPFRFLCISCSHGLHLES